MPHNRHSLSIYISQSQGSAAAAAAAASSTYVRAYVRACVRAYLPAALEAREIFFRNILKNGNTFKTHLFIFTFVFLIEKYIFCTCVCFLVEMVDGTPFTNYEEEKDCSSRIAAAAAAAADSY